MRDGHRGDTLESRNCWCRVGSGQTPLCFKHGRCTGCWVQRCRARPFAEDDGWPMDVRRPMVGGFCGQRGRAGREETERNELPGAPCEMGHVQTSGGRWMGPLSSTGVTPCPALPGGLIAWCVSGGTVVAGVPLQEVWLSPAPEAVEAREDSACWQAQAVTQRVHFISLRSFALFFFFFNPLASLTLFYNPSLGSLKSTLVVKHVGACE